MSLSGMFLEMITGTRVRIQLANARQSDDRTLIDSALNARSNRLIADRLNYRTFNERRL